MIVKIFLRMAMSPGLPLLAEKSYRQKQAVADSKTRLQLARHYFFK